MIWRNQALLYIYLCPNSPRTEVSVNKHPKLQRRQNSVFKDYYANPEPASKNGPSLMSQQ